MRLLLDMGLPRRAVADLRARGLEVEHVGELGLATATDAEILERAAMSGAVVCTLDADFARILALNGASSPSVVHLRLARVTRERLVSVVTDLLPRVGDSLERGAIVSVDDRGARVRPLPIHPSSL